MNASINYSTLAVVTFLVIVILSHIVSDYTKLGFIVSILANIIFIITHDSNCRAPIPFALNGQQSPAILPAPVHPQTVARNNPRVARRSIYGDDWDRHQSYQMQYPVQHYPVHGVPEAVMGIDGANAMMVQKRARDRRVIDGGVNKTADYYRYFYNDELTAAESSRWWEQPDMWY